MSFSEILGSKQISLTPRSVRHRGVKLMQKQSRDTDTFRHEKENKDYLHKIFALKILYVHIFT